MTVPCGRAVGVGLELEDLGLEEDLLEELVDPLPRLGRHLGVEHVAAEVLDHDLVLQELLLDAVGVRGGRSTLLMATTSGTPAFLAWEMASMVWGMTESSAATMRTTMSVTSAPRARMAVKAACPGVSRKDTARPSSSSTW
jgi:hypothetical protein